MWHYVLRRTAHLFPNWPCEYITNISKRCTLSRRQSGQIRCPSAKDGGPGGRWPTVKIWPPSGGQLADLIVACICLGRWMCLSRSCRKPGCCCYICRGLRRGLQGQLSVWKQMKSIWLLLACLFWQTHLTLKTNLIFTHSRSSHCLHGLWFWLTKLQRAWVFSQGDTGDKNVRHTTHLWSTSWGEPDTNITTPAAQHGLAYKQPADQQIGWRANSCTARSVYHAPILLSHRSWPLHPSDQWGRDSVLSLS